MTTRPAAPMPNLRELLAAAADEAGTEYDVSTQLVRWAERQRAEVVSAQARHRWHAMLAAAAVVVLVVGAAVLVRAQVSRRRRRPPGSTPTSDCPWGPGERRSRTFT